MKAFVLVNFEELALDEISELVRVKGKAGSGVVEFSIRKKKDLTLLCYWGQSFRNVLLSLGKVSDLDEVDFSGVKWGDYFFEGASFKVEVEGVKGNENRAAMSWKVSKQIFSLVKEELGWELKVDFKKPDVVVLIYFDGKKYYLGVDLCGFDLAKRNYRVFVNPASFKGDMAYYLMRKSGFLRGEKLAVGFVKDGTLAIEAGLFSFGLAVNKDFAFTRLPLFNGFKEPTIQKTSWSPAPVYGFDNSMVNIRAAKKNAKIAGVDDLVKLNKFSLDELDVKFSEGEVDRLVFQVTRKDEDKLNEIYYQASYVLRKKGVLMMIGRSGWKISISNKFKLISEELIKKGESSWRVWVMEKK